MALPVKQLDFDEDPMDQRSAAIPALATRWLSSQAAVSCSCAAPASDAAVVLLVVETIDEETEIGPAREALAATAADFRATSPAG